ncbi:hypothetical protein DYE50_03225 [Treponema ruminis]|uniref:CO/xanthine dehydrogenase Mo-binding subunit n=1 Tax=Treponema ruminis TaxID=744515 RepID=A0A7W8LLJ3_9SPIR|nr:molybdopterin cofactor-binding domain-containing protein [Treponema ruminis]MBB5225542.1 CO/xanthine dehydrogenase Mo-binding subunit [Treponema ruminis]QSI01589.1 hypothetical protein DYE50_03225 [Treponema ruminis]
MCAKRKSAAKKKVLFSEEFYSDMSAPDMLYAVTITSPFSYGRIASIDFNPGTKIPENYHLFTYRDIPGEKKVKILDSEVPVFSTGEISYKGEPIAILVGPDKEILEELKNDVRVQLDKNELQKDESRFARAYNYLTVSLKDGSAIEQSLIALRNTLEDFSKPRQVIAKRRLIVGDVDKSFADEEKTAFLVEGKWNNHIHYKSNKETEGCLCYVKGGNLHIFTPCQWISQLTKTVSDVTGFPKEKIFITRTLISHKTTNALWFSGIIVSQAAVAAIKTGAPVKYSLSRESQEELMELPPEISISHKTALDSKGLISAMDISIEYDSGSYNPCAQDILDRLTLAAAGIYNCKNVRVNARAFKSHNPPSSIHLAMLDSYSFFAVENQIQKIAEVTGFSPVELRQMNKAGGLQKSTKPFTFSFGRSSDAINAVAIRSDFKRKYAVARLSESGKYEQYDSSIYSPPSRGIGLACAFDGSGYLGPFFEKSNLSMQISVSEEKKLIVHAYPPSNSIREIWTKLITDNIEIDKRNIVFTNETIEETGKTKTSALVIPETLIGTVSIKTILLKKCLDSIKRKKIDGTSFSVKKSLPPSRLKLWNQEEFSGLPYYNTAFGTCTVELEFDSCTYRENIKRICVIIDGGKILSPKAAENAVHRSIQRCLAMLVDEAPLSCPAISVQFMQSEEEPKQIGHLVYSILPAAYTSALSQALAQPVSHLPLQTDSLFKICEYHARKNEVEE